LINLHEFGHSKQICLSTRYGKKKDNGEM
jgi:hypothetical protein